MVGTYSRTNFAICNKMNEPWGFYAKWNKPVREEETSHNLTNIKWWKC